MFLGPPLASCVKPISHGLGDGNIGPDLSEPVLEGDGGDVSCPRYVSEVSWRSDIVPSVHGFKVVVCSHFTWYIAQCLCKMYFVLECIGSMPDGCGK
jgi:hypothetical protein